MEVLIICLFMTDFISVGMCRLHKIETRATGIVHHGDTCTTMSRGSCQHQHRKEKIRSAISCQTNGNSEINYILCNEEHRAMENIELIHNNYHKQTPLEEPKAQVESKKKSTFWMEFKNHFFGNWFVLLTDFFSRESSFISKADTVFKLEIYLEKVLSFTGIWNQRIQENWCLIFENIIHIIFSIISYICSTYTSNNSSKLQNNTLEGKRKIHKNESKKTVDNYCPQIKQKPMEETAEHKENKSKLGQTEYFGSINEDKELNASHDGVVCKSLADINTKNTIENGDLLRSPLSNHSKMQDDLFCPPLSHHNKIQKISENTETTEIESHLPVNARAESIDIDFSVVHESHLRKRLLEECRIFQKIIMKLLPRSLKDIQDKHSRFTKYLSRKQTFLRTKTKCLEWKRKKNIRKNRCKCFKHIGKGKPKRTGTNGTNSQTSTHSKSIEHVSETGHSQGEEDKFHRIVLIFKNKLTEKQSYVHKSGCEIIPDKPSQSPDKKIPDLLEIRGSALEHEALVHEISERFYSKKDESSKEMSVNSAGKIQMIEKENQKDRDTHLKKEKDICEEKEKLSWLLQWKPHNGLFRQNMFVCISEYFERIATFSEWPMEAPVSAIRLCDAGFHYKGIGQLVECFTCKLQVSEWNIGDIPMDIHQNRSPQCYFLIAKEHVVEQNVESRPMPEIKPGLSELTGKYPVDTVADGASLGATGFSPDLTDRFRTALTVSENPEPAALELIQETPEIESGRFELDSTTFKYPDYATITARLESFISWSSHDKQDPRTLVDAGLFYIGRDDIVRCFCCDIGLADWEADDDPWTEHARHSPNCAYVIKEKGQEFIDAIQESWRQIYSPQHPHLADFHSRLQTYDTWPSDIQQRPRDLCEAGFFYTEEDDVVRCHYCDGGLRQWEPGDDPWTEHARWFPFCKYIVKIKGMSFIEEVARRYNALYNNDADEQLRNTDYGSDYMGNSLFSAESFLRDFRSSEPINSVLSMGYSIDNAMMAVQQYVQFNGSRDFTGRDLLNIIMERERLGDVVPETISNPVVRGQTINNQPSKALAAIQSEQNKSLEQLDEKELAERNKQLKNRLMCKTCHSRESSIVFLPCGDRVMCEICSENHVYCPKCNAKINQKIRSFLA